MQKGSFMYADLFSRKYLPSLAMGIVMLGGSFAAMHYAYVYSLEYMLRPTTNYVGDLLLDNLPVVDLNLLIIDGALLALAASILYLLSHPRSVLFSIKALAIFIALRALAMSLTHVGVYPEQINPGDGLLDAIYVFFNMQAGFFFSGHTGLPFLGAMIFWEHTAARVALLAVTALFGAAMLLSHVHYSIDVFAAPFMAYGVFHITRRLFPYDYELSGEEFGHYLK